MSKKISEERKVTYYIGMMIMIIGGIMFLSTFITSITHFGDFSNFNARAKCTGITSFGGIILLIIGGIIRSIGARGLAGSGIVLDPEKAREELEPYSRMAGGIMKDALDEADVNLGGKSEKIIMVKCSACGKLNEEDSKFCQECGIRL